MIHVERRTMRTHREEAVFSEISDGEFLKLRLERIKGIRTGKSDQKLTECAHNSCRHCLGTGVRSDRSVCIHNIACHCPMCSN